MSRRAKKMYCRKNQPWFGKNLSSRAIALELLIENKLESAASIERRERWLAESRARAKTFNFGSPYPTEKAVDDTEAPKLKRQ